MKTTTVFEKWLLAVYVRRGIFQSSSTQRLLARLLVCYMPTGEESVNS